MPLHSGSTGVGILGGSRDEGASGRAVASTQNHNSNTSSNTSTITNTTTTTTTTTTSTTTTTTANRTNNDLEPSALTDRASATSSKTRVASSSSSSVSHQQQQQQQQQMKALGSWPIASSPQTPTEKTNSVRKPQQQRSDPGGNASGEGTGSASGSRNGSSSGPRHLQREREVCFDFLDDVELDEDPAAFTRVCNLSNYTGFEMSDVRGKAATGIPSWKQNSLDSFARRPHLTRSDEQLNQMDRVSTTELFAPNDAHSCSSPRKTLFSPVTNRRLVPTSTHRFLAPESPTSGPHFQLPASSSQRPQSFSQVTPPVASSQQRPRDRVEESNAKGSRSQNSKESPSALRRILHSLRQSAPLARRTRNTNAQHHQAPTIRLDESCAAACGQHMSPSFKRRAPYVRFQSVHEEEAAGVNLHSPHHQHPEHQRHHQYHQKCRNHSHSESGQQNQKSPPVHPQSTRRSQSHRIEEEAVSEFTPCHHSEVRGNCDGGGLGRTNSDPVLDKAT